MDFEEPAAFLGVSPLPPVDLELHLHQIVIGMDNQLLRPGGLVVAAGHAHSCPHRAALDELEVGCRSRHVDPRERTDFPCAHPMGPFPVRAQIVGRTRKNLAFVLLVVKPGQGSCGPVDCEVISGCAD